MLDTQYFIDVTGIDHAKLLRKAYAMSGGTGRLSDDDLQRCLDSSADEHNVLYVPALNGRDVALGIQRWQGREWMYQVWHKHTREQLAELLAEVGISKPAPVAVVKRAAPPAMPGAAADPGAELQAEPSGFVAWFKGLLGRFWK